MAERRLYLGSVGPFLYNDNDLIDDPDGEFVGATQKGLATDGQLIVEDTPTASTHVLRLGDMPGAAGGSTITFDVVVALRLFEGSLEYKTREIAFVGGVATVGSESGWLTPASVTSTPPPTTVP